jgi:5-methylcytosine-specific restriction endonuclease McrA
MSEAARWWSDYRKKVKPWYDTQAWKRRRRYQLRIEPLCRMCKDRGLVVAARVVDHVEPHRGSYNLFVLGSLQSLCTDCHDRRKRIEEIRGYGLDCDESGWPIDPRHPVYRDRGQG